MNKMKIDNPFFEAMGRLGDIIIVNLLFLVCSLPVITAGASMTAMYEVFQKMEEGTEGAVAGTFLRCFRKKCRPCIPVWLCMLGSGAVLVFNMLFLGHVGMNGIWRLVGIGTGCLIFLWELVGAWIFPVMAAEDMACAECLKKAARRAVLHFPLTLIMVVFNNILIICLAVDIFYVMAAAPMYLVFGVGLTAYVNTKVIKKYTGGLH